MPQLSAKQFERVEEVFFQASSLPPDDRDRYLVAACGDDAEVREEVRAMLAHAGGSSGSGSGSGSGGSGGLAGSILDDAIAALIAAPGSRAANEALLRQLIGTRVGSYEFTDILGQGGMGVVYLARDVRLGRIVAVKALPPALSRQPQRMSRFVREAKILASLSNPNIATVFGLEEAAGTKFLVMERVEGETLAQTLSRSPLDVEAALEVACEIASGVEAAHNAGVIHRDLKPANVMFKPDGKVKVLDFGLARELTTASSAQDATQLQGGAGPGAGDLTLEGAVMGTPGYMSPEQVRGRPVDRRTDIFALGCILYECLSGRLAFPGETGADVIAGILERDPDWARLPANVPTAVRRLLARCLAKDADDRMHDMGDVRLELREALAAREWLEDPSRSTGAAPPRPSRLKVWGIPLGLSAAMAAVAVGVIALRRPTPTETPVAPAPLRRVSLQFPGNEPQSNLPAVRVALSRDGGRVVVSASDSTGQHLWVRDRADADFRRIEGTRGASIPALSPDAEWLAYSAGGAIWKRRISGGNPIRILADAGAWGAYRWGDDRQIYYVPSRGAGLFGVSEDGGPPRLFVGPRIQAGESAFSAGTKVPGGGVLFNVLEAAADTRIDAFRAGTGRQHNVVARGSTPRLARTPAGTCLMWERAGTLYAAPFDTASLQLSGPEVPVADGVMVDRLTCHACYDVADDGTLAYVPGPAFTEESRLAWMDTSDYDAPTTPLGEERMAFADPHLTSDCQRVSVLVKGEVQRAYVYDVGRQTLHRVMTRGECTSAAISPDGLQIAYTTTVDGAFAVCLKTLADGTEQTLTNVEAGCPGGLDWSPDGKTLAFVVTPAGSTQRDVWVLDVASKGATPFCAAPNADERTPRFSRNGNWLAFVSNESGSREVYIKSFPEGKVVRQVSIGGGGDWPAWSFDGRKLYYRGKGGLFLAPIAPNWADGSRPALVCRKEFGQWAADLPEYAVASNGRMLVIEPSERPPAVSQVNLVLNWHQILSPRIAAAPPQR